MTTPNPGLPISIEINVRAVAKTIDESDPTRTVDHTTNALPVIFSGHSLGDFVTHFLLQRSGIQDANHVFTGQEVMDAIMRNPLRDMNNGYAQGKMSEIDTMPGAHFRDKLEAFMLLQAPPPEEEEDI